MRRRLNRTSRLLRGALLLSSMTPFAACHNDERLAHDFERMRLQQRYDLYASSRVFSDGKTMQAPPEGTVARESAGEPVVRPASTTMPVDVTPAMLAEGKQRFGIYCAVCHGPGGYGGSIVAINMGPPRPVSLRSPQVRQLTPATLFSVITMGFGRMPPYDWQLSVAQRWAVVAYVRQLAQTAATTPEAIRDSTDAARLHVIDSIAAVEAKR